MSNEAIRVFFYGQSVRRPSDGARKMRLQQQARHKCQALP